MVSQMYRHSQFQNGLQDMKVIAELELVNRDITLESHLSMAINQGMSTLGNPTQGIPFPLAITHF